MNYSHFKTIYESLGLTVKDVMVITGKTRNTLDKWSQEGVVKDPAAATLFRLAFILNGHPYHYTPKEIAKLLQYSADEKGPQLIATSGALPFYDLNENEIGDAVRGASKRLIEISEQVKRLHVAAIETHKKTGA